ncbi:ABC transporter ATP-binding protein [Spiroplasma chinense]|uniref:ABC transporter ATP-binding protein n=1 Tax=Spiroplasma chinense TaxID=216932 RepID=A0A5B9Y5P5_9MOLU|nr:ABC transporter ATP-binding protein [Spiroplasma chinense]QEH62361.1 ABC transporter ATP-binding protein [Spiroplasma chinense]
MNSNLAISFKDLEKSFNDKKILKTININLLSKNFTAIMGPSGSGKTTLLNVASGLEEPTRGSVWIENTNMSLLKEPELTKFRRKNISYIFQDYNLIPYLNVWDNITIVNKLSKQKIDEQQVFKIIEKVGLKDFEKINVEKLSGGQKQRVAVARALASHSKIIFADEPTGALDIKTRNEVIELLKTNAKEFGKTLFVVTHDPFVASQADEVIFLVDGQVKKVVERPRVEEVMRNILELEKNV